MRVDEATPERCQSRVAWRSVSLEPLFLPVDCEPIQMSELLLELSMPMLMERQKTASLVEYMHLIFSYIEVVRARTFQSQIPMTPKMVNFHVLFKVPPQAQK